MNTCLLSLIPCARLSFYCRAYQGTFLLPLPLPSLSLPSADLWFTFRLLFAYLSFTFRLPRLTAIQVIWEGEHLGEPKLGAEC
ncbi:MAG: hypothetical protein LASZOEIN_000101 [Candidatus Fervidibacter sp.]|jgi:hypothetical protein